MDSTLIAVLCYRLEYDYNTRTTHNSKGVQIRVPGFGNTSTVEWLDSSEFSPSMFMFILYVYILFI